MNDIFANVSIVPVVVIDDATKAVPVAQALVAGGLHAIEVTLRTDAALDAIAAIAAEVPDAIIGAGTVLNVEQAEQSVAAGARFIVSPGLHEETVLAAKNLNVPIFPGVSTATEAQQAWNLGLRELKFFPAEVAGGVAMLKALGSVFRDLSFMPTGGISTKNLNDYLSLPAVIACGGSWLTPADAIDANDYEKITALAIEATKIAAEVRG
jgi:2-dehydro-3-deoxyphosphogluconate aldolase/(4S)-4-hydroxy-2-oxoglutarate aldolase